MHTDTHTYNHFPKCLRSTPVPTQPDSGIIMTVKNWSHIKGEKKKKSWALWNVSIINYCRATLTINDFSTTA